MTGHSNPDAREAAQIYAAIASVHAAGVCGLASQATRGRLQAMRRSGLALIIAAALVAGCGGGDDDGGGQSQQTTTTQSGGSQQASPQGKQVFTQNCKGCHTLAAAQATGTVGPNLDDLKPDRARVRRQVRTGGKPGGMPAFKGKLTNAQINAVAQYVSSVAGR